MQAEPAGSAPPARAPACDCHIHIYDLARHPIAQADAVSPPDAPWAAYRRLQATLGLERCVIVQPMGYGFDNRCTLEAVEAADGAAVAIAALRPGAPRAELHDLDARGVRGVRFMLVPNSGAIMTWDMLPGIANEIASLGWTINLQLDGRELPRHEALLMNLPCALVIDHVGKFLEPVDPGHASAQSLYRLLDTGRAWVKLSAMYETSRSGPPWYDDVGLLAKRLAHAYTERCLWASNWPHPAQRRRPDDRNLLALLDRWAPSSQARDRILRDNPQALYRFARR